MLLFRSDHNPIIVLSILLLHVLLLYVVVFTEGQHVKHEEYTCPYLWMQWKQKRTLGWICGSVPFLQTNVPGIKFEYDCCPGYEKTKLLDNKCAFVDRSWQTIISQLRESKYLQTAQALTKDNKLQDLSASPANGVYTVFVPQNDDDIISKEMDYVSNTEAVAGIVSSGRWYSKGFRNGQKIPTVKGTFIKVTTYSTGLTFLDCKVLLSPDHEASNGLVHQIDGALPPTYKHPTVLKRLNAEPDLSAFVQSLPSDLKRKLDEPDSDEWYTVFAVPNNVWNQMTSGISSSEAKETLTRQHVMEKMLCSDAIVQNTKRIGPTFADTHFSIQRKSDGNLVINDVCNKQIAIQRKDVMSGTGVIHVIESPISSLESMNLNEALECLKNNPSMRVRQSAGEIQKCNLLDLASGRDNVILLPNDGAFQSQLYKDNSKQIKVDKCKMYAHHLLKPKDPRNVDVRKTGLNQEQEFSSQYTGSDGSKHSVFSRYIRTRQGTTLAFNHAEVTDLRGMKFNNGIIYTVKQVNLPPQGDILRIVKQKPEAQKISAKLSATNFGDELRQHAPNVLFLAPIDMGWKTRDVENSYTEEQTRKLLQLHTIPHEFFGGNDGFIERGSVLEVESLLSSDTAGNKVKLLIKRTPDGNTFIGHKDLQENLWSMVLDWNRVGEDGVVWFIDWPMRCPERLC